jgi:phosphatidylethanolamine/phosphatidyl-N-methylethanolamine N-methyltransferase
MAIGNGNWAFFQAFLKSPRTVASVIPSSAFLERRVVRAANAPEADVIVEFGGGTGGITRSLLASARPDARVIVIERTAEFISHLEGIGDQRLNVVHGCASSIIEQLADRGHATASAVVSGIPFSTLPESLGADIIRAVHAALAPGGRFVAYQFTDKVDQLARPVLGPPDIERELYNLPPMRVYTWRKHDLARAH